MDFVGAAERFGGRFADADVFDFSSPGGGSVAKLRSAMEYLLDGFGHGFYDGFDWYFSGQAVAGKGQIL